MPKLAIYAWNQFALPAGIPRADLLGDTHANDPRSPDYNPNATTWMKQTFTFKGGPPTSAKIIDDDAFFEDAYVETGAPQTLGEPLTIGGVTYPAGAIVENEFSMLDPSGVEVFVVRIDGVNVGFAYPAAHEPTPGASFTANRGRDGDPLDSGDGISPSQEPYANMVCFAKGTLIDTPSGERLVESIRPGDFVSTVDHGNQQVWWIRQKTHSLVGIAEEERPVLIKAGSLGHQSPKRDLIVSAQHRILVGGDQLAGTFDTEVFVPAKSLTSLPGIRFMKGKKEVTWVHFACERHEVVSANGCLSESLLLGPMVLNGLADEARNHLATIFPKPLATGNLNGPPARDCLTVGQVRPHLKNIRQNGMFSAIRGRQNCSTIDGNLQDISSPARAQIQ